MSAGGVVLSVIENITFSTWHIVLILITVGWVYNRNSQRNRPPCLSGWIPFLGCAIEFGKEPLHFINFARDKLGSVFTLYVAGKRMTFITEHEDIQDIYFKSSSISFAEAVTDAVQHNASIPRGAFMQTHANIHDCVKGKLATQQLPSLIGQLHRGLQRRIDILAEKVLDDQKVELNSACRDVMYAAILDNLFGEGMLPTYDKEKLKELTDTFVIYDDQFEYGSQLPELFLKDWSKCKWRLLNLFTDVVKQAEKQNEQETLLHALIQNTADREYAPNFSLMMMWAALANAIPITFWTVSLILDHSSIHEKVKAEVTACMTNKQGEISDDDLRKMPFIKKCILEAIRVRSPGVIARKVVKPIKIQGYDVPAGDMLMLSPYWAHRNNKYFPEPEAFKPERWDAADLDKNVFLDGFVAFGGGRYQCPGRWFALMEIHMVITLLFSKFNMKLVSDVPPPSPLHVVGVQQPTGPCYIHMECQ